jgi:signal transduction histidine kinase/CheY-like chemotaxis protein
VVVAKLDPSAEWHRQIEQLVEALPDAIIVIDGAGAVQFVNGAAQMLFGKPRHELMGQLMGFSVRDGDVIEIEIPLVDKMHIAEMRVVKWLWEGKPAQLAAIRDITDRREIELQLRQAQKMEAIGQLTGGIAHDFNNILAIIIGMTELVAVGVAGDAKLSDMVKKIDDAAERGVQLVQRMLAFARKQPLEARVLNVNEAVKRAAAMLERTVGEHIALQTSLAEDLWPALADPSQLEDAIINLAVNARDAMPKGGDLALETANVRLDEVCAAGRTDVPPGDYVAVFVTDSGTGMPPEVIERAFEPFFTTKAVGRGSGLGLSMVYGFVRQSGGHVRIDSELGHGTSIRMYFPKAERTADSPGRVPCEPERRLPSGCETILVVEDDATVRTMAVTTLEGLGYHIHQAPDGRSALGILNGGDHIDLLFTDMIMPNGVSGQDLVEAARTLRPSMKTLLTSGYSEQFASTRGNGNRGAPLLGKPYRREKLATAVRSILDGNGGF